MSWFVVYERDEATYVIVGQGSRSLLMGYVVPSYGSSKCVYVFIIICISFISEEDGRRKSERYKKEYGFGLHR